MTLSAWLILISAMGGVSALGLAGLFIGPKIRGPTSRFYKAG